MYLYLPINNIIQDKPPSLNLDAKYNKMDKDSRFLEDTEREKPLILDSYQNFTDYLKKELSYHEFTTLYVSLGFAAPNSFSKILSGKKPWNFNSLVTVLSLCENPILPSVAIDHFKLFHNLSDFELKAVDNAIIGE